MNKILKLQACSNLEDVAVLFGYKTSALSYLLFKKPLKDRYSSFKIGKKGGGYREIKAPSEEIKLLQRKLSDYLFDCRDELGYKRSSSHGFERERTIITNARKHRNKRYVFNIDLEDFFPSIHFGRVRGFFIKNKNFGLKPEVGGCKNFCVNGPMAGNCRIARSDDNDRKEARCT